MILASKVKIDLGFADLYCRKSDARTISRKARDAYLRNKRIFRKDIGKFMIVIAYSRGEMDIQWGSKTEDWLVACANKERIALFPDRLIKKFKGTEYRKGLMEKYLFHEINHMFFYDLAQCKEPLWLLEGFVSQFDGYILPNRDKELLKGSLPHLAYSASGKEFFKQARYFYPMGYLAVRHLMKEHGKRKVLALIRSLRTHPTEKGFGTAFRKTFGYSVKELEWRVFD
jgi:hypothetical protein